MSFVGFSVKAEREFSESEEIAEALRFSLWFCFQTEQLCNEKPHEEKEENEK